MRKNVASQVIGAQMVSATDGSAFTGTVTVYVTGDAGTQALGSVGSGVCTHEGNGYHTYAPAQAETNYDLIAFTFIGTGAVPATVQVFTRHDSNLIAISNDAQSATDLKDFADAGYDPATNKVQGVVLVDTLTTYTGNTVQTGDAFARLGAPAGLSVSADVAAVKVDTAAILVDTNELQTDWVNGGRLDLLIDAILDDTGTSGVVVAAGSKTGYALSATGMDSVTLPANLITATSIAAGAITAAKFAAGAIDATAIATGAIDADALAADFVAEIWTTAITETYGTDGSALTGAQLLYLVLAHVGEFAIVSTTKTLKKLDGSTTAATYTLNDATTPTSITRAT